MGRSLVLAIAAIVAAACATPHFALRPPSTAARLPEGIHHAWETIEASDGTELFAQCWSPAGAEVTGLLVVVHGIKDHSSRYAAMAARVVRETGMRVCGMDHRGHGRSAGHRAAISSFDPLLDDLTLYLDALRSRERDDLPVFLFGHSMGGALSALLVLERGPDVAGVVLSAPALRIDVLPLEIAATGALSVLAPDAPLVRADSAQFSRDPEVVREMRSDPLVYDADQPVRMGGAFLDGIARVFARADLFDRSLLVLHGTGDRLTDPRGSAELVRRAQSSDATLRLLPGLYHDLVHEPEREVVVGEIIEWLRARLPGADATGTEG